MKPQSIQGEEMNSTYMGQDRRTTEIRIILTDEQIEQIASKAAEHAVGKLTDQVYRQVGKSVIGKFLWLVGALAVGIYLWAKARKWID